MKVYVHFDGSPEYTAVYRPPESSPAATTIGQLLSWYAEKYNSKHPSVKPLSASALAAFSGEARRELEAAAPLAKAVKDQADLYVTPNLSDDRGSGGASPPVNETVSTSEDGVRQQEAGLGLLAAGKTASEGGASDLESVPIVAQLMETAEKAEGSKNFRHASKIYEQLLDFLPSSTSTSKQCMQKLARLWLTVDRPQDATPWARKAVAAFPSDPAMLILLADCLSHDKASNAGLPEALRLYQQAQAASDSKSAHALTLAQARILFRKSDEASKAAAANLIMQVVEADQSNWQGLFQYAQVAADRGMISDAIRVLLRLLVERPNNADVKRSLAEAVSGPGRLELLLEELTGDAQTEAALAFLATCIKDHGAVDTAIALFGKAHSMAPSNPSYVLNLMHSYELKQQFQECIRLAISFCEHCTPTSEPVNMPLSEIRRLLLDLPEMTDSSYGWLAAHDTASVNDDAPLLVAETKKIEYDSEQLDTLAVGMTIVKVLFAGGALPLADRISNLLGTATASSVKPLHTTLIRNEAAYLGCVKQILNGPFAPHPTLPVSAPPLFLAGDSHCLSGAWQQVKLRGETRLLVPKLVTGCKIWHIRPESVFYPKVAFESTVSSLPNDAQVLMLFGEIDCREGLLLAVDKCKYDSLEEGIQATVDIYIGVLRSLIARGMELFIHPVPPVLNETRHIVMPFNAALKRNIIRISKESQLQGRLHWLDFLDELLTGDKSKLEPSLEFDGTHMSPKYVHHLAKQLELIS